jgi:hypothetical protein
MLRGGAPKNLSTFIAGADDKILDFEPGWYNEKAF